MNRLSFIFCVLLLPRIVFSQGTTNLVVQNQNFNSFKDGVSNFDYVYKTAPKLPDVNGSPYLFDNWSETVIKLKDNGKDYHIQSIKYDILNDKFEFNYESEIKILNGSKVQSFDIIDSKTGSKEMFISCGELIKDISLTGFCQVLTDGAVSLIKRKSAFVMNPTYNETLMVGNKNKEIIIEDEYFLKDEQSSQRIKDKGDIKAFFGKLDFDPKNYKKSSIKDIPELIEVIKRYNSKVKS